MLSLGIYRRITNFGNVEFDTKNPTQPCRVERDCIKCPFEHAGIFLYKNFINFKSSTFELFKKTQQKTLGFPSVKILIKMMMLIIFYMSNFD